MQNKMTITPPLTIHPLTLSEGDRVILAEHKTGGPCLVCWCPRANAGGVFMINMGIWAVYSPVTASEFVGSLRDRNITLPDGADLQRWIDALTREPPPPSAMN